MPYQPTYPYFGQMQNPYQPYIPSVSSPMTSPYQGTMPTPQYTPQPYQPQIPQAPQFVPVQIHGHTIKDEATEVPPNDIPMDEADPELRKRMKTDLTTLTASMN